MDSEQLSLWDKNSYNSLVIPERLWETRDLTTRVSLDSKFKNLREPLNFNEMAEMIWNKYSKFKVPKALIKSLTEYFDKKEENVDSVDLFQMYCSINSVFDGDVNKSKLEKWKEANKLSFFGPKQYELMERYVENKFGKD